MYRNLPDCVAKVCAVSWWRGRGHHPAWRQPRDNQCETLNCEHGCCQETVLQLFYIVLKGCSTTFGLFFFRPTKEFFPLKISIINLRGEAIFFQIKELLMSPLCHFYYSFYKIIFISRNFAIFKNYWTSIFIDQFETFYRII